jgi:lipopolysaccharide transport system ATP-binding protein
MSDTIIKIENISKLYRLGEVGTGTLRHDLNRWWHKVRGKEDPYLKIGEANDRTVKGNSDYAWALKDVSFDVKRGEVLGIIGRNGAGKSTLLKILSRVTTPTSGEIKIKGRVASLLEVGTGFNPELTGRDNIYLNGAILGMRKREIDRKFDEIVDFSGVERYVDTPVKRYSSGMYVRLAFAVAAYLEPEILIVDEVLAVGDAEFQKKCLGKMEQVSREQGRTVLFVSHNMAAMQNLCKSIAYMAGGRLISIGNSDEQIEAYTKDTTKKTTFDGDTRIKISPTLDLLGLDVVPDPVISGQPVRFILELASSVPARLTEVAILIFSANGIRVAVIDLRKHGETYSVGTGTLQIEGAVNSAPLVEGLYYLGLYIKSEDASKDILNLASFLVNGKKKKDGPLPYAANHRGFVELDYTVSSVETPVGEKAGVPSHG